MDNACDVTARALGDMTSLLLRDGTSLQQAGTLQLRDVRSLPQVVTLWHADLSSELQELAEVTCHAPARISVPTRVSAYLYA
eukprot:730312-Rhodomonas_salina.1